MVFRHLRNCNNFRHSFAAPHGRDTFWPPPGSPEGWRRGSCFTQKPTHPCGLFSAGPRCPQSQPTKGCSIVRLVRRKKSTQILGRFLSEAATSCNARQLPAVLPPGRFLCRHGTTFLSPAQKVPGKFPAYRGTRPAHRIQFKRAGCQSIAGKTVCPLGWYQYSKFDKFVKAPWAQGCFFSAYAATCGKGAPLRGVLCISAHGVMVCYSIMQTLARAHRCGKQFCQPSVECFNQNQLLFP